MQGLLGGFLSPEAGQARRAWLNEQDQRIDGVLSYFLGPQLMPRVRGAVGAANELTDFADYRDAVLGADQMATGSTTADRIAGAGTMATGLAAMMVPGVSARMAEGATDVAGDLARFIADEDGGIRVWHGSPHNFDKFSMGAIGTGEGAQAYGHGLYFAESEEVGRAYREQLARPGFIGRDGSIVTPPWDHLDAHAASYLLEAGGDYRKAIAMARKSDPAWSDEIVDILKEYKGAGFVSDGNAGRLYEVDLHANPEDFLDWDAPLSAQPERVRGALQDIGVSETVYPGENGEEIPEALGPHVKRWFNNPMFAPQALGARTKDEIVEGLTERGIPGIRFLDRGSRGAGDGTRNYVVFDENIIEIVKKYGIAGAAAMLGLSAADVEAQVAQQGSGGGW